ncbi:hypothetical protein WIMU106979_25345 [Williamsia muralis]
MSGQCPDLVVVHLSHVDGRRDLGIRMTGQLSRQRHPPARRDPRLRRGQPVGKRRFLGHRPVVLAHRPRPGLRRCRELDGPGADRMHLDVVGMPVTSHRVVTDEDLRTRLTDQLGQDLGRYGTGADECPRVVVRRRPGHTRVTPPAGAAQKHRCEGFGRRSAQLRQGPGQFADPVAPELIGTAVCGQTTPLLPDHLSLLTQRAGDDGDLGSVGQVLRDCAAGGDGLVVGMGVHEQQTVQGESSLFNFRSAAASPRTHRRYPSEPAR